MMMLLKNGNCFLPEGMFPADILLGGGEILSIGERGRYKVLETSGILEEVLDLKGKTVVPGLVDQHIHITGGGGEQGFASRIEEISAPEIFHAGVTTVVGTLGADSLTRSMDNLLAKARGLEVEGVSTWIYTGSYAVPIVTLTGSAASDLVKIDKVLGVGEIAISDHRSSQPTLQELKRLASEVHLGGMIGGKAGVMHIHVGDGAGKLRPITQLLEETELPVEQFVPTHINRSQALLDEGAKYCKRGGWIDLTATEGGEGDVEVPDAIVQLLNSGCSPEKISISSDANGSIPGGDGHQRGKIGTLFKNVIACIREKGLPSETVFRFVTANPASILKLSPRKGTIAPGADADLVVLNSDLEIDKVIAGGLLRVG